MSRPLKNMAAGLGVLFAIFLIAVLGYVAAGWPLLDAVYMVIITVFSVGYGEVRPIDSPELTIFTVTIIILGCSTVIYIMGAFVQLLTENQIQDAIGGKRMSKNIDQLSNHVIICGFGRVGRLIAAELEAEDTLIIMCHQGVIPEFTQHFSVQRDIRFRGVVSR